MSFSQKKVCFHGLNSHADAKKAKLKAKTVFIEIAAGGARTHDTEDGKIVGTFDFERFCRVVPMVTLIVHLSHLSVVFSLYRDLSWIKNKTFEDNWQNSALVQINESHVFLADRNIKKSTIYGNGIMSEGTAEFPIPWIRGPTRLGGSWMNDTHIIFIGKYIFPFLKNNIKLGKGPT